MEIQDNQFRWMGLTRDELTALWKRLDWDTVAGRTLFDVMWAHDTAAEDRISAIQTISLAVRSSVLPFAPILPEMFLRVKIGIATGEFNPRGFRRLGHKRRQRALGERLRGAQALVATATQFIGSNIHPAFEAREERTIDGKLLS